MCREDAVVAGPNLIPALGAEGHAAPWPGSGGDGESVAPHRLLERPHDRERIVVGPGDVQGTALPSERERAGLVQLSEMPARRREVGVRCKPETGGERHRAVHEVLSELDRRTQRG